MTTDELNQLVANTFDLPLAPYSTDLNVAMQLVVYLLLNWDIHHQDNAFYQQEYLEEHGTLEGYECPVYPYFMIEKYPEGKGLFSPNATWAISFADKALSTSEHPAQGICLDALRNLKNIRIDEEIS